MMPALPKGVKSLLIITTIAFFPNVIASVSGGYTDLFALRPYTVLHHGYVWQILTYAFLHAGLFHFIFNMFALFMFGPEVETRMGPRGFVVFYLVCAAGAGIFSLPFMHHVPVVGASGAILGLLYVYARMYPFRKILLFFFLPVNTITAVWIIGVISLLAVLTSAGGSIAHFTHLGGLLMGWLYWRYQNRIRVWLQELEERKAERRVRNEIAKQQKKRKYFEEQVDPILKKISQEGIHSLSDKEKEILKNVKNFEDQSA